MVFLILQIYYHFLLNVNFMKLFALTSAIATVFPLLKKYLIYCFKGKYKVNCLSKHLGSNTFIIYGM